MTATTYQTKKSAQGAARRLHGKDYAERFDIEQIAPSAWAIIEKTPAPVVTEKNVRRQSVEGIEHPTKLVWQIADEMHAKDPNCRRRDVMAECDRLGIAFYTARTQYQKWLVARRA